MYLKKLAAPQNDEVSEPDGTNLKFVLKREKKKQNRIRDVKSFFMTFRVRR